MPLIREGGIKKFRSIFKLALDPYAQGLARAKNDSFGKGKFFLDNQSR